MLRHGEDDIANRAIGKADIPPLHREAVGNVLVPGLGGFHPRTLPQSCVLVY